MKSTILCSLLLFSFVVLHSQYNSEPGFIVNRENDTVYGQITHRGQKENTITCYFSSSDGESQSYLPDQINTYGFVGGELYRSMLFDLDGSGEKPYFAQILTDGEVCFFVVNDDMNKERLFVDKNELGIKELSVIKQHSKNSKNYTVYKEYIGVLKVYLSDSKNGAEIDNVAFKVQDIKETIDHYNSTFTIPHATYPYKVRNKKRQRKIEFEIGLGAFYAAGNYKFSGDGQTKINENYEKVSGGGLAATVSIRLSYFVKDRFSIKTGIGYQKLNYEVEYTIRGGDSRLSNYEPTSIVIPFLVNYEFLTSKLTPYIELGLINLITRGDTDGQRMEYVEDDGSFYVFHGEEYTNSMAPAAGVGVRYEFVDKLSITAGIEITGYELQDIYTTQFIDYGNSSVLYNTNNYLDALMFLPNLSMI